MENQRYQLSPNICILSDPESKMVMIFHLLYDNSKIVNLEGLHFLKRFKKPTTAEEISEICDEVSGKIIREFVKIFFLVKLNPDEKNSLCKLKNHHWLNVETGQTFDPKGFAISDPCNFGCGRCIYFQPYGPYRTCSNNDTALSTCRKLFKQFNVSWRIATKCIDHYVALMKKQDHTHCKIHFGNIEPLINWSVFLGIPHYCDSIRDLTFEFVPI